MAAREKRFAPELCENEVIEPLENATPGNTKKATKYGMKIFQGKHLCWSIFYNIFTYICIIALLHDAEELRRRLKRANRINYHKQPFLL